VLADLGGVFEQCHFQHAHLQLLAKLVNQALDSIRVRGAMASPTRLSQVLKAFIFYVSGALGKSIPVPARQSAGTVAGRLEATAASPSKPVARNAQVAGSGTGAMMNDSVALPPLANETVTVAGYSWVSPGREMPSGVLKAELDVARHVGIAAGSEGLTVKGDGEGERFPASPVGRQSRLEEGQAIALGASEFGHRGRG